MPSGLIIVTGGSRGIGAAICSRLAVDGYVVAVNYAADAKAAEATVAEIKKSGGRAQAFQADVARLLELMVHSVYSDRDVFLRELTSNAADACEKLRYEAIARPEPQVPFFIFQKRLNAVIRQAVLLSESREGPFVFVQQV